MKKIRINLIIYIAMFLFAGITIFVVCRQSNQAIVSVPLPLEIIGEYSQNGGEWKEITEKTKLSAYEGDLVLRGRFNLELPEGSLIKFYLNHISMDVYPGKENVYEASYEKYPDMCGTGWATWSLPELTPEDVFEIHLHNPHSYGNGNAYNEFLQLLYMSADTVMYDYLNNNNLPYQIVCAFILVAAITLIGTAVGYQLMHLPSSSLLLKIGIMSLLMGVYMFFDTKELPLRSNQLLFNTCVRQFGMMFAAWILGTVVSELLKGKWKKIGEITVYVLVFADFVLMALSLVGMVGVYDTGVFWAIIQGIVSFILLLLCIVEVKNRGKQECWMLLSGMILLGSLLLELVNGRMCWWQNGICIKVVFTILFVVQLIRAVWLVVKNHQTSIKAEQLKEELKSSRIVLAMSQIRTHFIFNILNAISGMFAYDPKKADETLVMFSRYLRSNISVMDEDKPETFTKSLEHLEDYIQLEQIRFGKKLQFIKLIETENFMIPPLALQPIVENAIRHGLGHKKQGGTIRLHTWQEKGNNIIEISDDGVGFDTESTPREGAVGMKNVRFRLQYMVNGTMDVKSKQGEGTTVTITIPCDAKKAEKGGENP